MPESEENVTERPADLRNKLSKYVNLALCVMGIVFIITGVFKSTLMLYIGCALVGAAVGGFIRSKLPIHGMGPATGIHIIYRSELQRNVQSLHDNNMQTFIVMHPQQPCGIKQKKINQYTSITKYQGNASISNTESFDTISIISSMTDRTEPGEACCIICLIQFKRGQEVRQLPCNHVFHIGCIDRWLKINRLCPTCRRDITVPVKIRDPQVTSHVADIQIDGDSLVLNNQTAVEEDNSRGSGAQHVVNIEAVAEVTNPSLNLREDNITSENDVSGNLMRPPTPTDVVITVAEINSRVTPSIVTS